MHRILSALRSLVRWYLSPTGIIYALILAAGILSLFVFDLATATAVTLGVVLGLFIPFKLARERDIRNRAVRESQREAIAVSRDAKAFTLAERKNFIRSIEAVRQEWVDTLTAERLVWNRERDALLEDQAALRAQIQHFEGAITERQQQEKRELDREKRELEEVLENLGQLRKELDTLKPLKEASFVTEEALGRSFDRFSAQLNLMIAREAVHGEHPKDLLLVIAPQRTGSTWLFDLLRAHPRVVFWGTAEIYRALGVEGRRYPGHITGDPHSSLAIEVQEGLGGTVPAVDSPMVLDGPTSAIEKVHPASIGFDAAQLIANLDEWKRSRGDVQVVYIVREPADAIRSFLSYQKRAERWHADIAPSEVPDYYLRSFRIMEELISKMPGPIVTYEDLRADPSKVMASLYMSLWPSIEEDTAAELADHAISATRKENRAATQTGPFIAPESNRLSRVALEYGHELPGSHRNRELIESCTEIYHSLLNNDQRIRPSGGHDGSR